MPLTPQFQPDQQMYVQLLSAALRDPGIRNIALTGRYGAGKSSILQKFRDLHGERVLVLSLSTLGPAKQGETATNQIEKELVKQLLHSRPPGELPGSRYRRIERLSRSRTWLSSAGLLAVAALLLWLTGAFPDIAGVSDDHPLWLRTASLTLFAVLAIAALAVLRLALHDKKIASVGLGGASITLSDDAASYFDAYFDEIEYFFASVPVNIVIFEDLDRFNDPHIFEALRELNSLVNACTTRDAEPIRFVYALRDSVFEQLGHDTAELEDDAATAESVRSNRTKFFELVVPVVPFITHRNSRDLLARELSKAPAPPAVSPELIDLTARHLTDMRLLKNIRNEYAVFANRLITRQHGIRDLKADPLFAMVVYKNIHMTDFENVQVGRSALDDLYRQSRDLVRDSIATRRARLRAIAESQALADALNERSDAYGQRLSWYLEKVREPQYRHLLLSKLEVGDDAFEPDAIATDKFWRAVISDDQTINAQFQYQNYQHWTFSVPIADVRMLLDDQLPQGGWDDRERDAVQQEHDDLIADIDLLRRADFKDLLARPDFTLKDGGSFSDLMQDTIRSELARDLISRGFIDQNFGLYVAQYYGDRVPAVAMNFIVQHVQRDTPDAYYPLQPEDAAAVLRESGPSFIESDSAYNIAILDHLLARTDPRAETILSRIAREDRHQERTFLDAFFAGGEQATRAVGALSQRWPSIFERLIETIDLTVDRRLELVDAALPHTSEDLAYHLGEAATLYLQDNYQSLRCLTDNLGLPAAQNVVRTLTQAGFIADDIVVLDPGVRQLVVQEGIYRITAANLRAALDAVATLSLDDILQASPGVFNDCVRNPEDFLRAARDDESTPFTVRDPRMFSQIVTAIAGWSTPLATDLCRGADPRCSIPAITETPALIWQALARSMRFPPTVHNIDAYLEHAQAVDDDLARLLTAAGEIQCESALGDADQERGAALTVAVAVLNASGAIPNPEARVALADSIDLADYIDPSSIEPEEGHLLGLLLERELCEDEPGIFMRFGATGWETLHFAIQRSGRFQEFVTPELLNEGSVAQLLNSPDIALPTKQVVLGRFDDYVQDSPDALRAAGQLAASLGTRLEPAQITRVAKATADPRLVMKLIDQLGDAITREQILDALVALGDPYTGLAKPGHEVRLPKDDEHTSTLTRLRDAGLLQRVTVHRIKPEITVLVAE